MDLTGGWNSMRRRGQSPPWNEGRKGRRGERKDHRSRVQVNRANKRWKFGMDLAMKLNLLDWTRHSAGCINQRWFQTDQHWRSDVGRKSPAPESIISKVQTKINQSEDKERKKKNSNPLTKWNSKSNLAGDVRKWLDSNAFRTSAGSNWIECRVS